MTAPRRPRRILVADDNTDSASSLGELLAMMGNEVRIAHDGLEAVETAADFRPDLVFLDLEMPRLNGLDACRRIREQPSGQGVTIIALTGRGQREDRRRSEEAGFSRHIVKPVDTEALEELLAAEV